MTFVIFVIDIMFSWLFSFLAVYVCLHLLNGRFFVSSLFVIGWANMYIHQLIGTSINPPFWAAALFALALHKNAFLIELHGERTTEHSFWAYIFGGLVGWTSFAQIGSLQ